MSDHTPEQPEEEREQRSSMPPPMPKWPEESGDDQPATIPAKLQRAVWLMYAGAILTLASIPLNLGDREQMRSATRETNQDMSADQINAFVDAVFGLTIFLGILAAGLWVLMAWLNKRGKGWARITASVLGLLNIMFNLWLMTGALQGGASMFTLPALVSLLILAISVIALIFLWNPDVRAWFDQQKTTTA